MSRVVFLVPLALAACAPRPAAQCEYSSTHTIDFTGAGAHDVVTARAIGPTCEDAVALYAVREADGRLIWTWAGPLRQLYGQSEGGPEPQAFLQQWARAAVTTTNTAPAWPRLATGQTTLDRLTYEDIRARNLPMLCHLSSNAREVCAFWEPAAGVAGLYFERNRETTR
ncbi:MAG: hypothetical protein JSS00_06355 [Proteobacteria bacterium]|nr:hypothetical protein [Pseudomonadota bacterium]